MSQDELNIRIDVEEIAVEADLDSPQIVVSVDSSPSAVAVTPSIEELNVLIESESTAVEIRGELPDIGLIVDQNPDVIVLPTTGLTGPPGPPGPSGPPGPEGMQTTYTFVQVAAVHTWDILHNLNRFPSVTVIDSGGSEIIPTILYLDANRIQLYFDNITSGRAYLN